MTWELHCLVYIFHDDVGHLHAMALTESSWAGVHPCLGCLVVSRCIYAHPFVVVCQPCALPVSALWCIGIHPFVVVCQPCAHPVAVP
jgi:hypothetical protein